VIFQSPRENSCDFSICKQMRSRCGLAEADLISTKLRVRSADRSKLGVSVEMLLLAKHFQMANASAF
jgi:hypothetical protein